MNPILSSLSYELEVVPNAPDATPNPLNATVAEGLSWTTGNSSLINDSDSANVTITETIAPPAWISVTYNGNPFVSGNSYAVGASMEFTTPTNIPIGASGIHTWTYSIDDGVTTPTVFTINLTVSKRPDIESITPDLASPQYIGISINVDVVVADIDSPAADITTQLWWSADGIQGGSGWQQIDSDKVGTYTPTFSWNSTTFLQGIGKLYSRAKDTSGVWSDWVSISFTLMKLPVVTAIMFSVTPPIAQDTVVQLSSLVTDPDTLLTDIRVEYYWSPSGLGDDMEYIGISILGDTDFAVSWNTSGFTPSQTGRLYARAEE